MSNSIPRKGAGAENPGHFAPSTKGADVTNLDGLRDKQAAAKTPTLAPHSDQTAQEAYKAFLERGPREPEKRVSIARAVRDKIGTGTMFYSDKNPPPPLAEGEELIEEKVHTERTSFVNPQEPFRVMGPVDHSRFYEIGGSPAVRQCDGHYWVVGDHQRTSSFDGRQKISRVCAKCGEATIYMERASSRSRAYAKGQKKRY